jgi:hypothetical protein
MAIQKVVPPADTTGDHIAALFKLGKVRKKAYYRNTETGELYYDIRGGIAFPAQAPGGIIIIGILKDAHGEVGMACLDEAESKNSLDLLEKALRLRRKWGYTEGNDLLEVFWGDGLRFAPTVAYINQRLARVKRGPLIISDPLGWEDTQSRFAMYLSRLDSVLKKDRKGRKRLELRGSKLLRASMQRFTMDSRMGRKEPFYPLLTAAGFVVHGILTLEPWLQMAEHERLRPTVWQDTYEAHALRNEEEVLRMLYGEEDWGEGEDDDGRLIRTKR